MSLAPKLPHQYRIMALALTEKTEPLQLVREWMKAPRRAWALALIGGNGCGKSQAAALAWMVTPGAVWLRARRLQSMEWDARDELITAAEHAPLTVIDEMLSEGEQATEVISEIAEGRGEAFYRTIMLGNGTLDGFSARYGGRLMSRFGTCPEWLCEVNGDDLRETMDPILVEPPMEWLPKGLDRATANEFKHIAFMDGLDAATAWLGDRSCEPQSDEDRALMVERMQAELVKRIGRREVSMERASAENREAEERRKRERERLAVLDHLDYVATETGREPEEILAEIGRTRRTLAPEDRPRLMALIGGAP